MGQLSCVVMLAFVALHVAVIMCIIATATPDWVRGSVDTDSNRTRPFRNDTPDQSKGLWEFCIEDKNCTKLNETAQPKWFKAVQGLQVAGVGLGIFSLLLTYGTLLAEACKNSAKASAVNAFVQVLTVDCFLTALIVFGVNGRDRSQNAEFPAYFELDFGWSYYVNIAGACAMCCSALMVLRSACFYARRQSGYENI